MIVLGFIGALLPVMPAVPFLIVAAMLLGRDHPWIRPVFDRLNRFKKARKRQKFNKLVARD